MAEPEKTGGNVARDVRACAETLEAYTVFLRSKPRVSRTVKEMIESKVERLHRGSLPFVLLRLAGVPVRLVLPE